MIHFLDGCQTKISQTISNLHFLIDKSPCLPRTTVLFDLPFDNLVPLCQFTALPQTNLVKKAPCKHQPLPLAIRILAQNSTYNPLCEQALQFKKVHKYEISFLNWYIL